MECHAFLFLPKGVIILHFIVTILFIPFISPLPLQSGIYEYKWWQFYSINSPHPFIGFQWLTQTKFSEYLTPLLSKPQPNLNTTVGFYVKWLYTTTNTHHRNSMSAISQLLLPRFWWNFKGRFLWPYRTDSNCQGEICPRNICPYQEYLSCYWSDFDETLQVGSWEHLEQIPTVRVKFAQATFVLTTHVHIRNISAVTDPILMKLYR